MAPINKNHPRRVPQGTQLHALDENLEALIIQAATKLVQAAPIRRVRRVHGLLTEFRDLSQDAVLYEYYRRVASEAILDALSER